MSLVLSIAPRNLPIDLCRNIYNFVYGFISDIHTPVEMARVGRLDAITWIIEHEKWTRADLQTALETAAKYGHVEVVKYLLDRAPLLINNPLEYAAAAGHLEVVRFLVEGNNLLNLELAVQVAAMGGHLLVTEFLTDQGAYSAHAIELAAGLGHLNVVKYFVDMELFDDLSYPFQMASGAGKLNVVEYLAMYDIDEYTLCVSFQLAATSGHVAVVEFLAQCGADFKRNREFALRVAAQGGHLEVVHSLIAHGSNLEKAYIWANASGSTDVVEFLSLHFPHLKQLY